MKKALLIAVFSAISAVALSQDMVEDRLYYLDISVGYNFALPPFTSSGNSVNMLKPHNGGSMSFSFARKIGDDWGLQIEVLSATFKVKNSDLQSFFPNSKPSQVNLNGYNSTFFGVGAVKFFPFGKFKLDLKGSAGLNMTEFAKQEYLLQVKTSNPSSPTFENITINAKRGYAPALLLGTRLRYPIGETIDLGIKVEYGLSKASFDIEKTARAQSQPEAEPTYTDLGSHSKTISYINTGFTLGLRF